MKYIVIVILQIFVLKSLVAQQIYYEDKIGFNSTEIDTTLYWYGVYRKKEIHPRIIEQRLFLKPVKLKILKDSFCIRIGTNDSLISDYLIGFKKPINIDSFPEIHFLIDHNYHNHFITPITEYHYDMNKMGILKIYANGVFQRIGDSISINNYDLIADYQCYASPYMRMLGWWRYSTSFDIYASCKKHNLNSLLGIPKNTIGLNDLPYFIGAIDLNQDLLLDLIFLYKDEYYLLLSELDKNNKSHFSEVKKMKFEFISFE